MSGSRDLLAAAKGTGLVRLMEELTTSWVSLAFWLLEADLCLREMTIYIYSCFSWRVFTVVYGMTYAVFLTYLKTWIFKGVLFLLIPLFLLLSRKPGEDSEQFSSVWSCKTPQLVPGVVAVGLHGLVRRDQQFWALHNTLRIHVQPSSALAHCLLLSAGQHRYFWGSVVNCMKDLIWVYNSLDWGTESFNPHFSPCLFHLCDVPVCWQKRRWHRAGNMPWEEPASSSSSTQLGHLKWLRNCGLSCPVV